CDDRQRQRLQPTDQRIEMPIDQVAEICHCAWREVEVGEILPGAEATARACQHERACAGRLHFIERRAEFFVHRAREAVQLVWTVQRYRCDACRGVDVDADRFIRHRASPSAYCWGG